MSLGKPAISIVLTGLLLAFSFPPFAFPFVNCVALIPLLRRWLAAEDTRSIYLHSFYSFLIVFAVSFSWPLRHAYFSTAFASLSGVLLIPMIMALPFAAALPVKQKFGTATGLTALSSFFLAQEWFWSHGPIAMPSALLGHTLADHLYLNQFADIAGVPGLSLWVLGMNLLLLLAFDASQATTKWRIAKPRPLILALLLLALPLGYSQWRLMDVINTSDSAITALIIQPAPTPQAWTATNDTSRVHLLLAATDTALSKKPEAAPDLVIWPETAIPAPLDPTHQAASLIPVQIWTNRTGIPLLAGAISHLPDVQDPSVAFANSALLFNPTTPHQLYHKNRLVPFAEQVPFESLVQGLSFLRVEAGGVAGYQAGNAQPLFNFGDTRAGVLICFETLFGDYTRRYVKNGASVLIALSNIGWWGPVPAPDQYLSLSRLRAIETRRSLIISTVTGPSAVIEASGQIRPLTSWMVPDAVTATVSIRNGQTIYTRFGDWISLLALVLSAGFGIVYLLARWRLAFLAE